MEVSGDTHNAIITTVESDSDSNTISSEVSSDGDSNSYNSTISQFGEGGDSVYTEGSNSLDNTDIT